VTEEQGISEPEPAEGKRGRGRAWVTTSFSAVALTFSAYSLWESRLKQSDLRVFVPPVIEYSSPYQNSNFEVIIVPVTIANEGARAGTVLSLDLAVTDPKTNQTKRFYAANFGRWSARAAGPISPLPLSY
jgi:hypothetical protein